MSLSELCIDLVDGLSFAWAESGLLADAMKEWGEGEGPKTWSQAHDFLGILLLDPVMVAVIRDDDAVLGFDVVSMLEGPELQGHLLWIKPGYRGKGIAAWYLEEIFDCVCRAGLKRFHFHSGLERWQKHAPAAGFHGEPSPYSGMTHWVREA